ncbi:MAG TPA: S8 family serine peptidase [Actinomycetota bacterium]
MTSTVALRPRFTSATAALALLATLLAGAPALVAAPLEDLGDKIERILAQRAASTPDEGVSAIVSKRAPGSASLEQAVVAGGGRIDEQLPIVDGFSATFPARLVPVLAADANLRSLSLNRTGKFEQFSYDESSSVASTTPKLINATSLWSGGNYGQGVGIAVIDTGVSPMNDFVANGGRIVHGPDLSGENNLVDSYGHGTVMAGIIAGDGYDSQSNAAGARVGVAPRAWIVSVKVAGANGVTDVSTVLAAMHWVAAYRDQFNIRVVNLSWGTSGTQSYRYDPLNYAVERLWALGVTVVVAAGNSGPTNGTITKPADDPFVITVGAYNDAQNTDPADDSVPGWSSRGPTAADGLAKPDVVAPGRLIISARSYGSTVEQTYPKALYAPSYIRGSGTSQAAAATSGAAALLIRQKPHLSPAQVKYALKQTANPIASTSSTIQGAGRINLAAAAASTDEGYANATTQPGDGLGSLELSRGGTHVETDCDGDGVATVIQGEITAQCQAWDGASWTGASWTGASWTGASWTGASWTGASWTGASWTGASWTGASWTAGSWTGASWTTTDFSGASWTGASWTGASWTGASWTGGSWTGASWTGASWTGASWTTGEYDEWTTGEYDEFLTAFWGSRPPPGVYLAGEPYRPAPRIRTP